MSRTVIIGDVQGCLAELDSLFDRLALGTDDQVVFVGDLVARGPDSAGVIDRVIGLGSGALCVLGNHELKLLEARKARASGKPGPKLAKTHERLLAELADRHWSFMQSLPVSLELPAHGIRVVHAGVVPGKPLEDHDAWVLTHLRTIKSDGSPNSERDGTLWGKLYTGPPHIAFGHNAVDGLQIHEWATGLDTGCVYGRELTALVLPAGTHVPRATDRRDALVSVKARKEYAEMKSKSG